MKEISNSGSVFQFVIIPQRDKCQQTFPPTFDLITPVCALLEPVPQTAGGNAESVIAPPLGLVLTTPTILVGKFRQGAGVRCGCNIGSCVGTLHVTPPEPRVAARVGEEPAPGVLVAGVVAVRYAVARQAQRQAHPVGAAPLRGAGAVGGARGGGGAGGGGAIAASSGAAAFAEVLADAGAVPAAAIVLGTRLAVGHAAPVPALDVFLAVPRLAA